MNMLSPIARYKNVQVTTSSGPDLLLMLYDGFFRFCQEARTALKAGDRATFGLKVMRAHAIVEHLATVLDHGAAPDVAGSLTPLYVFIMDRLTQANVEQSETQVTAA
jgi:flagellar protein FliS